MIPHSRFLVILACLCPATLAAQARAPGIDSLAIRAHTYVLAHDLLEGRGTGARGADLAALYLASAAERLGLRGAGDGGSFTQRVPLVEAVVDTGATTLTLAVDGPLGPTRTTFRTPSAFLLNVGTAATLVGFSGEAVWVGSASEVLSRPDRLPPLTGRVAVMAGVFGGDVAAGDTLRARGASGVLHVIGSPEQYQLYVRSRGPSRLYVEAAAGVTSSFVPEIPSVIVTRELLLRMLPPGATEQMLAQPFVMTGRRIEVRAVTHPKPMHAQNVAAVLPGTDPSKGTEYIVFTAHYDHLGFSVPDERGDSLYNGFSDNAAGSAMLLALAQTLIAERPARSVLFLWFTGEERGLLGSDYYAVHPTVPRARMVGVVNLDAGAPPAPSTQWRIAGGDRSTLGALAVEVARAAGWDAQVTSATPNSDYFPFLRIGVPAVFLVPGPAPFEGLTAEASQALRRRWDRYHQAADHWAADFPFAGLVRYADFALRLGRALNESPRPRLSDPR